MAATDGLPRLLGAQARASAPDGHVWLAASAGTGKTQVLAARVFRLLLRGTDPSAILALTFTKAGAAEMAGRITAKLAAWVHMDDSALGRDLDALGEDAGPGARALARTLFARLLEARGGGLRIQTIHSFCQSLLAGFPLEADLVPGFRPIEGREEAILARETLAAMLVEAETARPQLIEAVGALSLRLGEGGAEAFLQACARAHAGLDALGTGIGPFIRQAFDLPIGDIEASLVQACSREFDERALRDLALMNQRWGTKSGLERAELVERWLASAHDQRAASIDALHLVWAKRDGTIRSFGRGQAPPDPGYADHAQRLFDLCSELIAQRARAQYADLLSIGLEAGRAYADAYAQAKRRTGVADFDDLIRATVALLQQPGMGDWIRYKLDLATEHVLVDEAQDTNPRQWLIIRAIADEFFAGVGTSERARTLFVVGDYKQAIFGFQGTDPIYFAAAEQHFGKLAMGAEGGGGTPFSRLSLNHSFRSTRPILEFVDAAMAQIGPDGLGLLEGLEAHASEVPGPGTVTLLPPATEDRGESEEEGWVDEATRSLAKQLARMVKSWLDPQAPLMLESKGRPLAPQDVMILVKRRSDLASLLVARFYAEGVPVAGVDRLRLNAPLAVQDLLAAIRFALQPDDDLSLASLLVSPLIGWSQEQLYAAAVGRSTSLWRHLRGRENEAALAPLYDLLARADFSTPHQLIEHLLSGPLGGRRSMIRRLGAEARDPIEELVSAALEFESRSTPSLQAFLDWFDRGEVEITRDPSAAGNAVRVMTAHGAKGLQAPVVILADACIDPARSPRSLIDWTPAGSSDAIPIFRPRAAERSGPLADLVADKERRELQEHWRLLYVAATRAEERLVIAGSIGAQAKGELPKQSWYSAAERAMTALGATVEDGVRVFRGTRPAKPVSKQPKSRPEKPPPVTLPAWATEPAPKEARPPRPLAPSSLGPDLVTDPPPLPAARAAAERGRLIHALLQRLPSVSSDSRRRAGEAWLAAAGGLQDADEREAILNDALRVIDAPQFAHLFHADALAEAPITAVLANGLVVSGTVDRLRVEPEQVAFVDFKTSRRPPTTINEIPPYHLRQMAAYAEALNVVFPGRGISAALLYTTGPQMFELPQSLLDLHKPGLGDTEQSYAFDA